MDQKQMLKQMIELNQTAFNNLFDATVQAQDQFEKAARQALDQIPGLPAEGRKVIDTWAEAFKVGRRDFKQQMDKGFVQAEKLLAV